MSSILPIIAAIVAFLVTALSGYKIIPALRKLKFGATILDIGPSWHKSKSGTPIMGGLMFIGGLIVAVIVCIIIALVSGSMLFTGENSLAKTEFVCGISMAIGMALIGFFDDYIKVVKKQNKGLSAKQKTFLQLLIAACYLISLYIAGLDFTWIPFVGEVTIVKGFGLLFWPIALIFIYGFTNAIQITDGVDGLDASVTFIVLIFFMMLAMFSSLLSTNVLAAAGAGACAGFLLWNFHPAKVFMGDTGSMFLGGLVVAISFAVEKPILLFFVGIIYLIEALSVVIQVTYYKKTKKRIFKMSPIHHHFELCGWSEIKIVLAFSLVTIVGCIVATALLLVK